MKARLVRIGNSRGVRLPRAIIEQTGLENEVELRVEGQCVVITRPATPRAGWAEAIRDLGPDKVLDPPTPTRFDEADWQW